ncbi:hypothetical protein MF672_011900 [Actinomadura sp. ATCC 31491]|uniref:Uncharacterized protein n=1 Tax=Actinomadura luzonensis TaxID=2805427 RepID=A0ABT0FQ98_9ACTN|nr:hypothetical protein [Actinomadura luzonensis]MCK2214487.1 hypothetical protein [Actinomadura luzonensis]
MRAGSLGILLLAALVAAAGVAVVLSLVSPPATRQTLSIPGTDAPLAIKTVPWRQGSDPDLPHLLVVGSDIEPGTYVAPGYVPGRGPNETCAWARLRGLDGRAGDVIAYGTGAGPGPVRVTILPTDKGFVTGGCGEWVLSTN